MEIKSYLEKRKEIQSSIHDFIVSNECDTEEKYQNLIQIFNDQGILNNNNKEIKTILRIIAKIANNHYRAPNFFARIEKIMLFFKDTIKHTFSNSEIIDIFKSNKRILLFFIEGNMISYDQFNDKISMKLKLFLPNNQIYFNTSQPDEIKQKQHIGENDNHICYLIRNDLIEEFIIYVNQNNIFLSSSVNPSIFETHSFLIKNNPSLIEYSAFFGSTQIFKYLLLNNAKFTHSLLIYAIHGNDPEIIELIKQNLLSHGIQINYFQLYRESIKCHHYNLSKYFLENFLENNVNNIAAPIEYYNFLFFPDELNNDVVFYYLCKYGHYQLVEIFLKTTKIDVNRKIVFLKIFL